LLLSPSLESTSGCQSEILLKSLTTAQTLSTEALIIILLSAFLGVAVIAHQKD
jgi:hypothetical protein